MEKYLSTPPMSELREMEVPALLKMRQDIRVKRDEFRLNVNQTATELQTKINRQLLIERRNFDMRLNELKRRLKEESYGAPAGRIAISDINDEISKLNFDYRLKVEEQNNEIRKSANDRRRQLAKIQLDYENAEIDICKAIREKDGFREYGLGNQAFVRTANGNANAQE